MKKKDKLIWIIPIIAVVLDQLTKFLIRTKLTLGQSIPILKNIFHITYIQNTGAGFGILRDQQTVLIWISITIIGVILYNYENIIKEKLTVPISLILAGTIGNLIDRIFLRYVVDFLDFRVFPAFNVADSCLTIGAIWFAIKVIRK